MAKNGKCKAGHYYCYTDKKCKPIPKGFKMVGRAGYLRKENGHSVDDDENKNGNGSNGNGSNGNGNGGGVSESKSGDSSLRDWFGKSKSSDGKPGWVQLGGKYAGKPCAKQPGQTTKPKCGSSKMKRNLSKDEEQAAFRRKNAKDPNPNRSGKAINVKTEETILEKDMLDKQGNDKFDRYKRMIRHKQDKHGRASVMDKIKTGKDYKEETVIEKAGEKDACYHKVKSRYSVWPSAYASGALVKCRKKGAANWGNKTKKEEVEVLENVSSGKSRLAKFGRVQSKAVGAVTNDEYAAKATKEKESNKGKDKAIADKTDVSGMSPFDALVAKKQAERKAEKARLKASGFKKMKREEFSNWRDDFKATEYEFTDLITPEPLQPTEGIGSKMLDEKCWKGYTKKGMKTMFGKRYPNCVKKEEELNLVSKTPLDEKKGCMHNHEGEECPVHGAKECPALEKVDEAVQVPRKTGNMIMVYLSFRGKMYSIKMFFPSVRIPSRSDIQGQIEKVYPGGKVRSYQVSDYEPGEPVFHSEGAAWTKKSGKNKEGGLNEKGRKSYEAENPGSDLKAPSKKKGNKRRASFCARMKGMKKKLTSAKTARDPDSRINKSLRAWNC